MAAALAFYTTFSLAPLLIIAVAIAGLVFGREAAQGKIVYGIQSLVGISGAHTIQELIDNARKPASGTLAAIVGVATLLLGSTAVVGELQDSLNTVWKVKARPRTSLLSIVRTRFISFAMVLGVGFLLLVSLILSTLLSVLTGLAGRVITSLDARLHLVDLGFSFLGITVLFALLYKVIPDVKLRWRDVWAGAAAASLLFAVGKFALGLYLGHSSVESTYGAAGSLVVLLLWVYYSAQILLFGAEFAQVSTAFRRLRASGGA
jgi:membrane protein